MHSQGVVARFENKKRLLKMSQNRSRPVMSKSNDKSKDKPHEKLLDLFGKAVLTDDVLKELLTESTFRAFKEIRETDKELDREVANQVANAMKEWATRQGATHFTHWFQPMNGSTAEKHDSFITFMADGSINLKFSGSELIRGEPDASSFPSGGIRSTFEARGYTAWDMSTPAFLRKGLMKGVSGYTTLCIPTAFCSYTGEALDIKTPLLRSEEVLSHAAVRLLKLMGNNDVTKVYSTLGAEQEFFLIDRGFYLARPDLIATGRTLIGAKPSKGQELEDHYFGKMPRRVQACLEEVDLELWELGVPSMTRHNEVGPSQYEMAPIFEKSTLATDHNMLTMEILRDTANKHGLVCLLHEKPFAYVNGSGKHNNWSMSTNRGKNLLNPGETPEQNLTFLMFLTAVLRAVHIHSDLLRASVAVPGNDYRLGANEAPPAIISAFLGDHLNNVCQSIIQGKTEIDPASGASNKSAYLELSRIAKIPRDTTDRNRTSPFAFTGNKFEFRAVGSSQSCAFPVTTINTIVAESLLWLADEIERRLADPAAAATTEADDRRADIIQAVIRETLTKHYAIVFNGNNYSEEWVEEAARRGLPNLRTAPEALAVYDAPKNIQLFADLKVLTPTETKARSNICHEFFLKHLVIEASTLIDLTTTHILPAALQYQKNLSDSFLAAVQVLGSSAALASQKQLTERLAATIGELMAHTDSLRLLLKRISDSEHAESADAEATGGSPQQRLAAHHQELVASIGAVRGLCDSLELMVDDALWPLPKYSEMLFLV